MSIFLWLAFLPLGFWEFVSTTRNLHIHSRDAMKEKKKQNFAARTWKWPSSPDFVAFSPVCVCFWRWRPANRVLLHLNFLKGAIHFLIGGPKTAEPSKYLFSKSFSEGSRSFIYIFQGETDMRAVKYLFTDACQDWIRSDIYSFSPCLQTLFPKICPSSLWRFWRYNYIFVCSLLLSWCFLPVKQ